MKAQRWIDIRYKCRCMAAEATLPIPERQVAEDIAEFMERMRLAITVDHRKRSPLCIADKLEYAKLPMDGDVVGGAAGGRA